MVCGTNFAMLMKPASVGDLRRQQRDGFEVQNVVRMVLGS
jgi:hypothetical protein